MSTSAELVQRHMDEAAQFVAREAVDSFRHIVPCAIASQRIQFDSPLEELFFLWWHAILQSRETFLGAIPDNCTPRLGVHAPVKIGRKRYVLDFVVDVPHKLWRGLAVELDGHEFHERTRQQVRQRDQRDRDLQVAGWTVFHFSFAEFDQDPYRCTLEVWEHFYTCFLELVRAA